MTINQIFSKISSSSKVDETYLEEIINRIENGESFLKTKEDEEIYLSLVIPWSSVESSSVVISPNVANEILANDVASNRKTNRRRIAEYTRCMLNKEWNLSDPLQFDTDGLLFDGQHRLHAVVKANIPVEFIVLKGMPLQAKNYCDLGQSRSADQVAQIAGYKVAEQHLAIPRLWHFFQTSSSIISVKKLVEFYLKYQDGIDFALDNIKKQRIHGSRVAGNIVPVKAAIAQAYYYENHERLATFAHVLVDGFTESPSDNAAIALKHYLEELRRSKQERFDKNIHRRALRSIELFCQRANSKRSTAAPNDIYPLPDFLPQLSNQEYDYMCKRIAKAMILEPAEADLSLFDY